MAFLIGFGGILGTLGRVYLNSFLKNIFPWGTFFINVSGSFFIGLLYQVSASNEGITWIFSILGIGFCGAYTTFSTFSYECVELVEARRFCLASVYFTTSIVLGLLATWLGLHV